MHSDDSKLGNPTAAGTATVVSLVLVTVGGIISVFNGAVGLSAAFGAVAAPLLHAVDCHIRRNNLKEYFSTRSKLYEIAVHSGIMSGLFATGGYLINAIDADQVKHRQDSARIAALDEMSPDTPVTVTAKQAYCGAKRGWVNPPGTQKKLNCN